MEGEEIGASSGGPPAPEIPAAAPQAKRNVSDKMKTSHLPLAAVVSLLLLCASCDDNRVVDEYHTLPDGKWHKDSVLTFTFPVARKTDLHNIYFNIRNDRSYEYSNLWLFVTLQVPGGELMTDTVQVTLAEPSGKWLGKGMGGIYDNRMVFRRNVYFPASGEHTLYLSHGMRPETLEGITDAGIRIEKVK